METSIPQEQLIADKGDKSIAYLLTRLLPQNLLRKSLPHEKKILIGVNEKSWIRFIYNLSTVNISLL